MRLEVHQLDRAAGVLVGQACGDALGVPYEFGSFPSGEPEMKGGGLGPYAPGEYSDDTQMAVCIAEVAATGADLTSEEALDRIATRFLEWQHGGASDMGNLIRKVLSSARRGTGSPAERLQTAARSIYEKDGQAAGNGALMRTGIVGLASLDDLEQTAAAARVVADLTHADPLAGDSCVLWSIGVAVAVREGTFAGVRQGLEYLPPERRAQWAIWLDEAEGAPPHRFSSNGFTVTALQAAYAAVTSTPVPDDEPAAGLFPCLHFQHALAAAVCAGDDTDTVAAIAGALLGARWGLSGTPARWRRIIHGWPNLRSRDLVRLAVLTAREGKADSQGWPLAERMDYGLPPRKGIPHPADAGVILGTAHTVGADWDAVVSLCRLGSAEVPAPGVRPEDHIVCWLIDTDSRDNPNLAFVLDDAARTVQTLREEGRRVLLHCVKSESRTPTVAARYGMLLGATPRRAKQEIAATLGHEGINPGLWDELDRFGGCQGQQA